MPGACDQAGLAELLKVLADGELEDLAWQGDRGRQWVGVAACAITTRPPSAAASSGFAAR
jgi:hypothetical protein